MSPLNRPTGNPLTGPLRTLRHAACTLYLGFAAAGSMLAATATAPAPVDYSRDVRPILGENCFHCHGADPKRREGELRLDTMEGQRELAVIPGKPDESELIKRIFAADDSDEKMPPLDSHRTLTAEQKNTLRRWIAEGAPFAAHWTFTSIPKPALPETRNTTWSRNAIDRFVLATLEANQLTPSPEASRETLLRRVTLDLTGLPPTPDEIDAFLADKAPNAYERAVDRLLASPHYGERMALPWLDAARYADSNGFQQDGDTFQWIWRDWVVKALNANMPFDQFTIEQLAGDLLPSPTTEQKIATAFNRNHLLNGEGGAIAEEQRHVALFDRVDATATNWLGLTVACAQCHDHKFDPITQKDYYSLMAAFNNLPETGIVSGSAFKVRVAAPILELATPEQKTRLTELERELTAIKVDAKIDELRGPWEARVAVDENYPDSQIREIARKKAADRSGSENNKLRRYFVAKGLATVDPDLAKKVNDRDDLKGDGNPRVMIMADTKPRDTFVLDRGNYLTPKDKVAFATPAFLPPMPEDAPRNRLGLAQWLVAPEQPLTARVVVNRHWQTFFGRGLVKTSEDFGVQSEMPVHRALLDWLAFTYRATGWDTKNLHRLMVTSATYRQSSRVTSELRERDPENKLYARGARFRLPAMLIRDQALAASGLLVATLGGKPVYPYQPADIWDSLAITKERDFTYPLSTGPDLYRRSLYTFWRRTVAPSNMFDASSRNVCSVRGAVTSTPLHALTTLNDPTYVEAARALAARALRAKSEASDRLAFAFRAVLGRAPDAGEQKLLAASLAKQRARYDGDAKAATALLAVGESKRDETLNASEHAAYTAVCLGILNLDEALTKP